MKVKNYIILLFILAVNAITAQDKMVFKDGKKLDCKIVAINPNTVTYKDSSNAEKMITVPKSSVLMAEFKSGSVYIFGNDQPTPAMQDKKKDKSMDAREREKDFSDNIIGIQIPDLLFGRLTLSYERLFLEKQLGIAVPVSLSFDPQALFSGNTTDTSANAPKVNRNLGYVTGVDVNYYFHSKGYSKFFVGPRFRYGTDANLGNITAYTIQIQNGFLLAGSNGRFASTLAFGFGFARILAAPGGGGINPNQSYPWGSFTFRLAFRA